MTTRRVLALLALLGGGLAACGGPQLTATATAAPTELLLNDAPVALTGVPGPAEASFEVEWTVDTKPDGSAAAVAEPHQAVTSFTPDVAGTYELTFTVREASLRTGGGLQSSFDGSKPASAKVTLTVSPRPAKQLAFVVQPSDIAAGAAIAPAVTVEVRNDRGEKVATATPAVTIALQGADGGTLLGTGSRTAEAGTATFADLSVDKVGTWKLVASADGLASATSAEFHVTPAAPDLTHSTFGATPATALADGQAKITLSLTLHDRFDNAVPGISTVISASGTANTLTGASGTTDEVGHLQATLASTKAEEKAPKATFGELELTTSARFLPGLPVQAESTLACAPTSAVANGTDRVTCTLTLRDAFANPVPGATVDLTVGGTGNTVDPGSAPPTAEDGTVVFTVSSTVAEAKTLSATVSDGSVGTDVTFVPGPPDAAHSTFTADPTILVADGVATTTLTAIVRDAFDNAVPGISVGLSATGTGNTLGADAVTTDATGKATTTLASTKAEEKTATASYEGQTATATVTFTAGPPVAATSTLVANPTTLVANDVAQSTLTATIRDAKGNPVPGVAVTFAATGARNTFDDPTATTDANGVATANLKSKTAEVKTVTATFGTAETLTKSVTFTAGPAAAAQSTLTANPGSVAADNTATSTLTATIRDANGNVVAGTVVTFTVSGSNNALSSATATTNASGVASVTLKSSTAEVKTVTASFGTGQTKTASVSFTAQSASAANSTLVANPTSLVADDTATSTITATIKDVNNNVLTGAVVTFSASGTQNTFSAASATTNASGVATVTLKSKTAEVKTVTASFGAGLTKTTTVTFTPGAPVAATSTLAAAPTSVVADNTATSTLTATIRDANNNVVPSLSVAFSLSGTGNTLSAASATTNASGVATITVKSTKAEAKTATASFGTGQTKTATVTFTAGAPAAATTTFTAAPASVVADNTATSTMTATLLDANGNAVANSPVTFAVSGTGNTLSATSGTTNAAGVATATVKSTKAEAKTATLTYGASLSKTAPITFTAGTASAATSTLTANPTTLAADNTTTSTITATILDANANPVSGLSVGFTVSGAGATLGVATATTNAAGVATTTLKSSLSGAKTVTASFAAQTKTVSVTFTCTDKDGDGYGPNCLAGVDCDDERSSVHPNRAEVCQNGLDDDCSATTPDNCPVTCPAGGCGVGCADGQREAFVSQTTFPNIAACAGGFAVPGTFFETPPQCSRIAGDDSTNPTGTGCAAEDLCAQGWHVCKTSADVRAHSPAACQTGISAAGCGAAFPASTFFVARQSGNGCAFCSTSTDPTAICAGASQCLSNCYPTSDQTNDLFGGGTLGNGTASNCTPLDKTSGNGCGSLGAPWACSGTGLNESIVVTKTGAAGGGVLCCSD